MCLQVSSALDKLSTRERFLNSQCQHLTTEYAEAKEHLSRLQVQYNLKQDAVNEQDMELGQIIKVKWIMHASRITLVFCAILQMLTGACISPACCTKLQRQLVLPMHMMTKQNVKSSSRCNAGA